MKKTAILLAASAAFLFAGNSEITAVVGGASPLGDSKLEHHLTYGLRLGIGLDSFIDQVEVGYDFSNDVEYAKCCSTADLKSDIHRIYFNGIKEFDVTSSTKLYGLLGVGYEIFVNGDEPEDNSAALGQYGLGIKQYFTDSFALRGEVRHAIQFDNPHRNYLFYSLGLVLSFGAEKAQAAPVVVAPVAESKPTEPALTVKATDPAKPLVKPEMIKEKEIQGTVVKKIVINNAHFNFGVNSAAIQPQGVTALTQIAKELNADGGKDLRVLVGGHTDSTGSEAYNQKLSEKRAQMVKAELVKLGVSADRIVAKGYGETRPVGNNKTKEGRAQNRRSEVIFVR